MKLSNAMLCLDCDDVCNVTDANCPGCGSAAMFPLAKWINSDQNAHLGAVEA